MARSPTAALEHALPPSQQPCMVAIHRALPVASAPEMFDSCAGRSTAAACSHM